MSEGKGEGEGEGEAEFLYNIIYTERERQRERDREREIQYPIGKYIHKGFPPSPPHPTPCWGRPQRGRGGGMRWGGGRNPLWVYFHIGYRIFDIHVYRYTNDFLQKTKRQRTDEIATKT